MTLTEWPAKLNRRLTPAQVRMIRDGWDKAKAAGWLQRDWCGDVGALLGIGVTTAAGIVRRETYADVI